MPLAMRGFIFKLIKMKFNGESGPSVTPASLQALGSHAWLGAATRDSRTGNSAPEGPGARAVPGSFSYEVAGPLAWRERLEWGNSIQQLHCLSVRVPVSQFGQQLQPAGRAPAPER